MSWLVLRRVTVNAANGWSSDYTVGAIPLTGIHGFGTVLARRFGEERFLRSFAVLAHEIAPRLGGPYRDVPTRKASPMRGWASRKPRSSRRRMTRSRRWI